MAAWHATGAPGESVGRRSDEAGARDLPAYRITERRTETFVEPGARARVDLALGETGMLTTQSPGIPVSAVPALGPWPPPPPCREGARSSPASRAACGRPRPPDRRRRRK